MNRFYKYLKSFDSFILEYSKLVGRILSVLAILFFLYKLTAVNFSGVHFEFAWNKEWYWWLGVFFVCFILNHGIDAYLWRYILKRSGIQITTKKALQMNWKSLLFSISTPNRIGEIPARRMLLKEYDLKTVYKSAGVHFVFKPLTFILLFILSFSVLKYNVSFITVGLFVALVIGTTYFMYKKSVLYINLITLNSIRVASYCLQHVMLLLLLSESQFTIFNLNRVVCIHSAGAVIPHVFGTEVFIKSSLYELIQINGLSWEIFTWSLLILWSVNIVFPAIVALGFKEE